MIKNVYQFQFEQIVYLDEAEAELHRAIEAAEGLYGEAVVRMDAGYRRDDESISLYVDGSTEVSQAIVRVFTAFITKQFGATSFVVSGTAREHPLQPIAITT